MGLITENNNDIGWSSSSGGAGRDEENEEKKESFYRQIDHSYYIQLSRCSVCKHHSNYKQYELFADTNSRRIVATTTSRRPPTVYNYKMKISRQHLLLRFSVLFATGVFFALVLNLLQVQRKITIFPPEMLLTIFSSAWWVPPACGIAAAIIGLLYPCLDHKLGEVHSYKREWSSVMRCVAVFVGINHASTKIAYANNFQLSLSLAAMSIGLWWLFDRSRSGFGLGVAIAVIATFVTQLLVYHGVYRYTEPDFLYVRSWLPCIFFSGGVTMGNIGRQLAVHDYIEDSSKEHIE
ncbi:insulin-induced gene 2 protein-like [Tubulanus polymorphus]|uniref:insulin-induced gene 2 protein-like n=1 Tax=Tubulanus polymorphus TaxID=672921 RepID=UPI003DA5B0EE